MSEDQVAAFVAYKSNKNGKKKKKANVSIEFQRFLSTVIKVSVNFGRFKLCYIKTFSVEIVFLLEAVECQITEKEMA